MGREREKISVANFIKLGLHQADELSKLREFITLFFRIVFSGILVMNKSRMIFVAACFVATLTLYSLYAHVLVPVVLPAKERTKLPIPEIGEQFEDRELLKILFPDEDTWVFDAPNMISFSDRAGMILFKNHDFLEDGQIRVSPCVVLWFPDNREVLSPEEKYEKYRQAVVLEAANYALLEFDGSIDFLSNRPQLKSGQLKGNVTIRSDMKKPDTSDDVELITSDVLFDFNHIQTRQRVDFKFGPNRGYGHDLTIEMTNTDESKKGEAPNTVKRVELRELGELHLFVESNSLNYLPDSGHTVTAAPLRQSPVPAEVEVMPYRHVAAYPQQTSQSNTFQLSPESSGNTLSQIPVGNLPQESQLRPSAAATPSDLTEVQVYCKGIVDLAADLDVMGQWLLTFRNQVNVLRVNPQGASDQLNCHEFIVTFGQKDGLPKPTADNHPLADFGAMSPLRVKAIGNAGSQVIARSPENKGFQAIGQEMVLDLVRKELSLTKGDEVSVNYDQYKIKGNSLYYAYGDASGLGKLDMPKGGTLEGIIGTDASKHFELTWNGELKVLPDKSDPNLTLVQINGKPKVKIAGMGTAIGDEILIWCDTSKKTPAATGTTSIIAAGSGSMDADLKKILMRKNVILTTDNGEIETNELEIEFQPSNLTAQATRSISRYPNPQVGNQANRPSSTTTQSGTNVSGGSLSQLSIFGNQDGNKSSFKVRADKVDVLALIVGGETIVDQILLTKNVILNEKMSVSGQEAIHISGQKVHIDKPQSEQMTIRIEGDSTISGGHAVFQGRGVTLMGANINIDQERNLFKVDGRGQLRISQQAIGSATTGGNSGSFNKLFASPGSAASASQGVIIDWGGSMRFDGQELLFIKDVDINYSMMAINKSDKVAVYLTKPFRFFEKNSTNEIEPERVVIYGNIDLERDTYAENNGGQTSHDYIRLTAIEIFPISGTFKGLGPGYISSIFMYTDDGAAGLLSNGLTAPRVTPTSTSATASEQSGLFGKGLKFIQCNFADSVTGNFNTNQYTFYDRVVTMICPAQSFRDNIDTNNLRKIVANGMLLECNKLEIAQPPNATGSNKSVDLKAEGNTRIEMTYNDRYYIANANKIKYEQFKNLITLESNQYSKVELYEGANMNAQTQLRADGERIYLNPVTKEVRVTGFSTQTSIP